MRERPERSDASYHPATFQAPNLRDKKSFTFPANYTGEPAPLVEETGEMQRPLDANKRKDNAHNNKAPKTSNLHVQGSSRNGGVSDPNKPAIKTKKKTVKEGVNSAGKRNGSRLEDAFSSLKSKMRRD
ncbi:hypothetical protein BTUL_0091g00240 [Botrytis tulipae]|uniref:Uncharacterized protein n=1 Tax=Botrytis tulipae TaxID=87230 RepID=A0A4Z1EM53_9HELO|nr:hypothetical protein BTUL_0091g00240 [Botrytis tulipae]